MKYYFSKKCKISYFSNIIQNIICNEEIDVLNFHYFYAFSLLASFVFSYFVYFILSLWRIYFTLVRKMRFHICFTVSYFENFGLKNILIKIFSFFVCVKSYFANSFLTASVIYFQSSNCIV